MQSELTHVYVFGPEGGPLKIGRADIPEKRMRHLQTGHPSPLVLLHKQPVPRALAAAIEWRAHWLLKECRSHGEWFTCSLRAAKDALRSAIESGGAGEKARGKVGRVKINDEQTPARFPEGTLARIDALLADKEKRSDFIREAVEREIKRRSRIPKPD